MRVAVDADHVVFDGALAKGELAYVDADTLPAAGESEVAPLVMLSGAPEPDVAAGDAVRRRARAAAAALGALDGRVEVVGRGAVAHVLRGLLAWRVDTGSRPAGVVDVTGDPAEIVSATQRLADLGTLVLAGDSRDRRVALDLYPDVHLRGLRIVGVADDEGDEDVGDGGSRWEGGPAPAVTEAVLGRPAPAGRPWYRVTTA